MDESNLVSDETQAFLKGPEAQQSPNERIGSLTVKLCPESDARCACVCVDVRLIMVKTFIGVRQSIEHIIWC